MNNDSLTSQIAHMLGWEWIPQDGPINEHWYTPEHNAKGDPDPDDWRTVGLLVETVAKRQHSFLAYELHMALNWPLHHDPAAPLARALCTALVAMQ